MKKFKRFFEPGSGRSINTKCDERTLTVPDVVPSLKEIVLSGSATRVGALLFDDSESDGVKRLLAQGAPLEMILAAQFDGFPPEPDANDKPSGEEDKEGPGEAGERAEQASL